MAEKLDSIDREIERELHNLSLDELSTSDADSEADVDQSLQNSPAEDNVSSTYRGIKNVVVIIILLCSRLCLKLVVHSLQGILANANSKRKMQVLLA